jgi:hypothetical protein
MGEARVASGDLGAPLVDIARAARCSHLRSADPEPVPV